MPERTSKGTENSPPAPSSDMHQGDFAQMTRALGERVRQYRARRGMSRKVLSRLSGVSERYLAQMESGRANVSFHILWNLAQTMDTGVTDLLHEHGLENPDLVLARRLLETLSPQEQSTAYALLRQRFGNGRNPVTRVGLIGLRGGGKTTLGRIAANHFGVPFLRLSQMVEEIAGMELAEIFVTMGQKGYRRLEMKALQTAIAEHRHAIIETGGSLVSEPATFEVLLSSCFTIWVKAAAQEHMQRVVDQGDTRPLEGHLQQAMDDLTAILHARASFYGRADATLDTSNRTQAECGAELIALCAPYLTAVSS